MEFWGTEKRREKLEENGSNIGRGWVEANPTLSGRIMEMKRAFLWFDIG